MDPGGGGALLHMNKPTIAAVNGAAAGYGCELALMCDMRIASEKARFGEVQLRVGRMPEQGMRLLPRLVGLGKADELMLTGDIIDATEAERIGLVNKVVPHEQLEVAAGELATKIAKNPPLTIRLTKEGIHKGLGLPLELFLSYSGQASQFLTETEDHKEGARAFAEKREPVFKGK
jgi:enoyl-CoA hydratase/carnithine racemase